MTTRRPPSTDRQHPTRWTARTNHDAAPEARAADLLREGDWSPTLGPAARARIFAHVRSMSRWRGTRLPAVRWAMAALLLFTSGGLVAGAATGHWPRFLSLAPAAAPEARQTTGRPKTRRQPSPGPIAAPPVVAAAEEPAPTTQPAPTSPEPIVVQAPAPAPIRHGRRPSSTLSDESQLLGQAMLHLRQQGDATQALVDLEQYAARFPRGTLRREATIVRIDALLSLKRDGRALPLLKQLELQAHGRDQELRVIRGELSASEDCRGAIADFDRLLSQSPPSDLSQRALYGRAGCRLQLGDSAGAAGDLDQYLRQFPQGRFATEASRARASIPGRR